MFAILLLLARAAGAQNTPMEGAATLPVSGQVAVGRTVVLPEVGIAGGGLDRGEALADAPSFTRMAEMVSGPMPKGSGANAATVPPAGSTAHELYVDREIERTTMCESGEWRGKVCRVSWIRILGSSMFFLSAQHGGNIGQDDDARYHLLHHTDGFWGDYVTSLHRYRYNRWNDDDPFTVNYIGHPIMGAITNYVYEQNDPKQRALLFENTHRYWMGRLRATAFSALYSAQWKVGPLSETSVGNIGIKTYYSAKLGRYTNETGMVDFFVTPTAGLLWNVGEDYIDRKIFSRVAANVSNRYVLVFASFMVPCKSGANILRFRAPYYRDRDLDSRVPLRP